MVIILEKPNNDLWDYFDINTKTWFKEKLGEPTAVQKEAWPSIAQGRDTLVSAPTGTGKTLTAFLVFIDRLKSKARSGLLKQELELIYVSPLKSLAGDIRENLRRPLEGIAELERAENGYSPKIDVAIRTGDTPQSERRRMIKSPPHILIITPESLYLMLSSLSGQKILTTAKALIIDELHAIIDSKRGAHLMFSIARLDKLCKSPLQRIGLSATIEPLSVAAEYLSPDNAEVIAPKMKKNVELKVISPFSDSQAIKPTIWEDLSHAVYKYCQGTRTAIAFVDGRAYAEKLAYNVNLLAGEGFARTHHGSLSKEQRHEVEIDLRNGDLRLLCATSSMELGIDVGDIDQVLQIGCPFTISGTMQRLGRAGHSPGRTSVMYMFPRTAAEGLYCGMTSELARNGGIEHCKPPELCFDVLAQHLVSMATGEGYYVDEIMDILPRAYPFRNVKKQDVLDILAMLAGDYEHARDIPVRPRILFDRIHERVEGDAYSRMLAVSAGGTIPDKGNYTVKTEKNVKIGEVYEEFVFESKVGDKFMLGTFAWKILSIQKDAITVEPASSSGARMPFWRDDLKGRGLQTGIAFGKILASLNEAHEREKAYNSENAASSANLIAHDFIYPELLKLGLDEPAAKSTAGFLRRQFIATGILPDDKNILIEHYKDESGNNQMMVHSVFGRQINTPLAALAHETAVRITGNNIGCVDDDNGFLLNAFGDDELPKDLLYLINPDNATEVLEALLPITPVFSMTFRYNIAHSLLTGVRQKGRTPLWLQRIRSAEMLEYLIKHKNHPIIRETKRECINDFWDLEGFRYVMNAIKSGEIKVHEFFLDTFSPMALPLQWSIEGAFMYDYFPTPRGAHKEAAEELEKAFLLKPSHEKLAQVSERGRLPKDEKQLHSLLMIEGDIAAEDFSSGLEIPLEWLELLTQRGQAQYVEPGLWIASEHADEYTAAFGDIENIENQDTENEIDFNFAREHIIRRFLRYRGARELSQIANRYCISENEALDVITSLIRQEAVTEDNGFYYHAELYDRARRETINSRREVHTLPPQTYAALLASRIRTSLTPEKQLENAIKQLIDTPYPINLWENVIFPARVDRYNGNILDGLLAKGEFFWRIDPVLGLSFHRYEDIDWDFDLSDNLNVLENNEKIVYEALLKRGASFIKGLSGLLGGISPHEALIELSGRGLVSADNFIPVRQWLDADKIKKAPLKQRINARVTALSTGRWEISRPVIEKSVKEKLEYNFDSALILCRETIKDLAWGQALEVLRIWEYTGQVRRGYFIEGMSGAQFIRDKDYQWVTLALNRFYENAENQIIWLSAQDPAQPWGKCLVGSPERTFMNIASTAVAFFNGLPVASFERQGKTLRVFDYARLPEVLALFSDDFKKRKIFAFLNKIVVKEYAKEAEEALVSAGFTKQMMDYVLYNT